MGGRIRYDGGPEDGQTHWRPNRPEQDCTITVTEAVGTLVGGVYRVTSVRDLPGAQPDGIAQFDADAVWEAAQGAS